MSGCVILVYEVEQSMEMIPSISASHHGYKYERIAVGFIVADEEFYKNYLVNGWFQEYMPVQLV